MDETENSNELYWKGFKLPDGKQRWLYTSDADQVKISKADWFTRQTEYVVIHKGYETAESSTKAISGIIYIITVVRSIRNYFGDKSGYHYRSVYFIYRDGVLYKSDSCNQVVEVKRITKELKGILTRISQHEWENKINGGNI